MHKLSWRQHVNKMLKGVVTACMAGLIPYLGPAHYIYACYLKSQIASNNPPSERNLESVWLCGQISHRTFPWRVCWNFLPRCDAWMRVATPITPLDHLRSSQLGCHPSSLVLLRHLCRISHRLGSGAWAASQR